MNNSSEDFINQITLQYMLNKRQYGKYLEKKSSQSICEDERSVYYDRFLEMTQQLLKQSNTVTDLPSDLKLAFDNYLKTAIRHYKIIDNLEKIDAEDAEDEDDSDEDKDEDDSDEDDSDEDDSDEDKDEDDSDEDDDMYA